MVVVSQMLMSQPHSLPPALHESVTEVVVMLLAFRLVGLGQVTMVVKSVTSLHELSSSPSTDFTRA